MNEKNIEKEEEITSSSQAKAEETTNKAERRASNGKPIDGKEKPVENASKEEEMTVEDANTDKSTADEKMDVDEPSVETVKKGSNEASVSSSVNNKLENELSEIVAKVPESSVFAADASLTRENLLSVLEDLPEAEPLGEARAMLTFHRKGSKEKITGVRRASKEAAKPAAVLKEATKPAAVLKETTKPATESKQAAKLAMATKEAVKPALTSKEVVKPTVTAEEVTKPTVTLEEAAMPTVTSEEMAKPEVASKEVTKPTVALKEAAKLVAVSKEVVKPATKEVTKSAAASKDAAKTMATPKEVTKSAVASKEAAKPTAVAKEIKETTAPKNSKDSMPSTPKIIQELLASKKMTTSTPKITREMVTASTPKITKEMVTASTPRITRDMVTASTPRITREMVTASTPKITKETVTAPTPTVAKEVITPASKAAKERLPASPNNVKEAAVSAPTAAKEVIALASKTVKTPASPNNVKEVVASAPTVKEVLAPVSKTAKERIPSAPNNVQEIAALTPSILKDKLTTALAGSKEVPSSSRQSEPSKQVRKYVYKLKSKTGRVLKYTSSVPIVLKKPIITLTKMEEDETSDKVADHETDGVDSDNSTKENHVKENNVTGELVKRTAKKRGRPPLSQKAPVITLDDQSYSSDTTDSKDNFGKSGSTPSSFGMQTRKRQLKFLPDGRLVRSGKKFRASSEERNAEDSMTSPSETEETDEDSLSDTKTKKPAANTAKKKFTPVQPKLIDKKSKMKKMFDFESYFREKSALPSSASASETPPRPPADKQRAAPLRIVEMQKNASASSPSAGAAVTGSSSSSSTPAAKSSMPSARTSVDPAQLLSSLIGVPISPNQLNVVKFKPKVIQDRTTSTPRKIVTSYEEVTKKSTVAASSETPKSAPYKIVSKPTLQKILPRPSSSPDKMPILKGKLTETKAAAAASPSTTFSSMAPKLNASTSIHAPAISPLNVLDVPKFDAYTDTRIVKTKDGPKKFLKQKTTPKSNDAAASAASESTATVYDLVQNVFDQMPSWNLHIIPDTNSFCIAQVSRGRMGIPILKKSIELNAEFSAKVYVHQLHCKKYDGVYDTESKILSLIREIDALAA